MNVETVQYELTSQPLMGFQDLSEIPSVPGLYSAWLNDDLKRCFYVGIAYKELKKRIRDHFSGSRGSDQFCLYVYDTCIYPIRTPGMTTKEVNRLTKQWVRDHIRFRVFEKQAGKKELQGIETELRKRMQPTLNSL